MSIQSLVRWSQIKKNPRLIMPMSKKYQNMKKKLQSMSYNMMIGYDIYDRFTMEYFPLRQSMILTTNFFLLTTVSIIEYYRILMQKVNFF
jgi:hypothetical protein